MIESDIPIKGPEHIPGGEIKVPEEEMPVEMPEKVILDTKLTTWEKLSNLGRTIKSVVEKGYTLATGIVAFGNNLKTIGIILIIIIAGIIVMKLLHVF